MCIWPWSTIRRLRAENRRLYAETLTQSGEIIAKDLIIVARREHVEALWKSTVALQEIAAQVTPSANATTRRMGRLATEAVERLRQDQPWLLDRLTETGGKAVSYEEG